MVKYVAFQNGQRFGSPASIFQLDPGPAKSLDDLVFMRPGCRVPIIDFRAPAQQGGT